MRKLLLVAAALGGLAGLGGTGALAAPAVAVPHFAPERGQVIQADYYYQHRHWHHRHWEHHHWHYY